MIANFPNGWSALYFECEFEFLEEHGKKRVFKAHMVDRFVTSLAIAVAATHATLTARTRPAHHASLCPSLAQHTKHERALLKAFGRNALSRPVLETGAAAAPAGRLGRGRAVLHRLPVSLKARVGR